MPAGKNMVQYVGGGGGMMVYGQRCDIPRASEKTDSLSRLRSRAYCGVYDGTQTACAWNGAIN